ncbi:MAG: ribonuclease E/G, partial [Pseudomonadota bacterium]
MAKKMLIDATHAEETRVVVVDGTKVEEFDFESVSKRQIAGNIYLAKVTRVEPSLQAAFVDYGGNRHGFLAFSEIHPDYYQIPVADREALIAEELAYAQAEAEDDEPKPKKKRSRRRKKSDAPKAEATEAEVSEATETTDSNSESDPGAEAPADEGAQAVDESAPMESAPTERADETSDDTEKSEAPAAAENTATDEKDDDKGNGPSSMAHAVEGEDPTVTSDKVEQEENVDEAKSEAHTEPEVSATSDGPEKTIPGMDVVDAEATEDEGPLAVIGEPETEQPAGAAEEASEGEVPAEKPKRRRARRRKKDDEAPAEETPDIET